MSEWIKWEGGECPVPVDTLVDVELRDGTIVESQLAWGVKDMGATKDEEGDSYAGWAFWKSHNHPGDIIAYRIHKEES